MKHIYKHLTLYSLLFCFLFNIIGGLIFINAIVEKTKYFNIDYHMSETEKNTYVITGLSGDVVIPRKFTNIQFKVYSGMWSVTSLTVEKGNKKYYSKGNCIIEKGTDKLMLTCENSIIPLEVKIINSDSLMSMNIKYEGTPIDWLKIKAELDENSISIKNEYANVLFNVNGQYSQLEKLVVPDGITEIHSYMFRNFNALKEVKLSSSVTKIGDYAFYGCKLLTKVVLNEGLIDVGEFAFGDCTKLVDINIPNSLTYFSNQMFWNCTSLKDINIHSNIKQIGGQAFYKCALEEVYISENVEIINGSAFDSCHQLKKLSLPFIGKSRTNEGVESVNIWYIFVGSAYFSDRLPDSLEELVIYGDAVIKENYLKGTIKVKKIYLLDNVKVISDEAFTDYDGYWDVTVYCEANNKPDDWSENWDQYIKNVEWGYKG